MVIDFLKTYIDEGEYIQILVHKDYHGFIDTVMSKFISFHGWNEDGALDTLTKLEQLDIDIIIRYGFEATYFLYYNGTEITKHKDSYNYKFDKVLTDRNIKQANLMEKT